MPTVVLVLVPSVHLFDLAGPAQVFDEAAAQGLDWHLAWVADAPVVPTAQGLPVAAGTDWPAGIGPDDLVVVPGWAVPGPPGAGILSAALAQRLRAHHAAGGTVAGVCAGAFALARAGLLDGRRCTTHHELVEQLAREHPRAHVVPDVLWVRDGSIVTSAGIASGVDLALHLLAVRHGPAVVARVARALVVPLRRGGDDPQDSVMLRHRDHLSDLAHRAQDVLDAEFERPLPLAALARRLGVSERTLTRAFVRATGLTPLRYQQALRRERAERLRAEGATADAAARAVGFADARMLRRRRSAR